MDNLFVLITSNLYKFALLSQTSSLERPNIQILHCRLGHVHIDNIIKLIPLLSGLKMSKSRNIFFCETYVLAK